MRRTRGVISNELGQDDAIQKSVNEDAKEKGACAEDSLRAVNSMGMEQSAHQPCP
jgi:hypothetical protein